MKHRNKKLKIIITLLVLGLFCLLGGCAKKMTKTNTENEKVTSKEDNTKAENEKITSGEDNTNEGEDVPTDATEKEAAASDTSEKKEQKEASIAKNGDFILARPSENGALQVINGQLSDEKGEKVMLRGISTHGIAWFPDYVNQDCFSQISEEFGANLIRLAMYTDENGGYCTDGDKEKLKQMLLDGVAYAKEADMYVIVDWHVLHDLNPQVHKAEALAFFDEMTKKLAGEKHVIYEICNEPNGGTGWEDVKSYANEVLPVIRNNAPDAIVLIGTPTWSQEIDKPQNDPVTGYDNILYTLHFYAATHKDDLRSRMIAAVEAGTPVFVSEYGLCDASGNGANDLGEAQKWIDTMDRYGISYAVWSLCNKEETSALISASCNKKADFTPDDLSESGKWIYEMLQKNSSGSAIEKKQPSDGQTEKEKEPGTQGKRSEEQNTQNKEQDKEQESAQKEAEKQSGTTVMSDDKLEIKAEITGSWESDGKTFYQYTLSVTNKGNTEIQQWEAVLQFSDGIALSDGWNGEYTADGSRLVIKSKDYNGKLATDETAKDVGFIISGPANLKLLQS